MVETIYVDQSASNLRLSIVEGELKLDQFNVLSKSVVELPTFKIEAKIIGASHIIHFLIGEKSFYEVFACTEVKTATRLISTCTNGKDFTAKHLFGNYEYNISVEFMEMKFLELKKENLPSKFSKLIETDNAPNKPIVKNDSDSIILIHRFPGENHQPTGLAPYTAVFVDLKDEKSIRVVTIHNYTNEGISVFTETKVLKK